jgi:hypothetical protein
MTRTEAIALVKEQLRAVTEGAAGYSHENWNDWRRKRDEANAAAIAALTAAGATVRDDWRGTALKFDGLRVTCTGGIGGALNNWLARAERESAQ